MCLIKGKKAFGAGAAVLALCLLLCSGCGQKVITVADDINAEKGEGTEYVEMEKFTIKKVDDVEREDIGYCALLIPSDFTRSADVEGMYVSKLYPLDSANIYYSIEDASGLGVVDENLTSADYEKAIEGAYKAVNKDIDLLVDAFDRETLSGVPCFKIRSHYNAGDRDVQMLVYIVMASQTHVITYTQLSDDEMMADFETYEGEIKLVRERSNA